MPKRTRLDTDAQMRDGSTAARAILEDQNAWRRRHCPGATLALQSLRPGKDGKYFDVLTLWTVDGKQWVVWFDVTALFGKGLAGTKKRSRKSSA